MSRPAATQLLQSVPADKIRIFRVFALFARLFPLFLAVFRGTAATSSLRFAGVRLMNAVATVQMKRHPHHCRPCSAFSND
jgi:hypothetical protein